jgi:four helix bundle protein
MVYDLEERLLKFSQQLVSNIKLIKLDYLNKNIIDQLLKSGTSIGANYHEANGASSKKDFRNKIYICKKEAKETCYWLKIFLETLISYRQEFELLLKEADEITRIFNKIAQTLKEE